MHRLLVLAFLLALSAHAAQAQNAIDSASGKDLTLGAGGKTALTIKNGTENVGIGTNAPQAALDVNGGVKVFRPRQPATRYTPGTIRWNNQAFQGCDGTQWITFSSNTGCNAGNVGAVIYSPLYNNKQR